MVSYELGSRAKILIRQAEAVETTNRLVRKAKTSPTLDKNNMNHGLTHLFMAATPTVAPKLVHHRIEDLQFEPLATGSNSTRETEEGDEEDDDESTSSTASGARPSANEDGHHANRHFLLPDDDDDSVAFLLQESSYSPSPYVQTTSTANTGGHPSREAQLEQEVAKLKATIKQSYDSLVSIQQNADLRNQKLELEIAYLRMALSDEQATTSKLTIENAMLRQRLHMVLREVRDESSMRKMRELKQREVIVEKHLNSLLVSRNKASTKCFLMRKMLLQTCSECRSRLPFKKDTLTANVIPAALSSRDDESMIPLPPAPTTPRVVNVPPQAAAMVKAPSSPTKPNVQQREIQLADALMKDDALNRPLKGILKHGSEAEEEEEEDEEEVASRIDAIMNRQDMDGDGDDTDLDSVVGMGSVVHEEKAALSMYRKDSLLDSRSSRSSDSKRMSRQQSWRQRLFKNKSGK